MPRYRVSMPFICTVWLDVDADDRESAEEIASEGASLQGLVGNGGVGDKMIGVVDTDYCIDAPDDFFEGKVTLAVEVEELDE